MPQTQVYPRWRGEHITPFCDCPVFAGLSPLARGTRVLLFCAVVTDRFIPAGAGNTPTLSIIMVSDTVYPRWRGEHSNQVMTPTY